MGVTDRNILLFLAQIEEQIDYIVQASIHTLFAYSTRALSSYKC